jgi:molecular chaperone DnaK
VFSTAQDSQTAVDIHVLQGEREFASDSRTLGKFQLSGIPAAPRGMPQIEVSFDIDANGILNVSAKDLGTGKEQKIVIQTSSGLTETEIQKMQKEAESHASEDKKRRELVDQKNKADQFVYTTEKELKEFGAKVDEGDRKVVEEKVQALNKAKDGSDSAAIQKAIDDLEKARHKIAEQIYKQQAAGAAPGDGGAGASEAGKTAGAGARKSGEDEDIVDADFEVKE